MIGIEPTNTGSSTPEPQKSNTMMFVIGIVVLIVIGVAVVFVMNRNTGQPAVTTTPQPTAMQESPTTAPTVDPSGAMMEKGEVKEFTVTGRNFSLTPNVIRVNEGDTVKITFKNTGGFHDFVLDEFGVKTAQIQDGQSETVEFVADKAGTYEYYCSVGNHRAQGMKGQLIVE